MSPKIKTDGAHPNLTVIKKRNITVKQAKSMLAKNGLIVSEEETEKILDFLYFLGELTVQQYFKDVNGEK